MDHFVIVGAGLAGAKTAEHLRGQGFDGRITLIGDETLRPYERPPLSKGILLGSAEPDSAFVHPAQWYADNAVDLVLGNAVTGIDLDAHRLSLSDGEQHFDKLAFTTGARPRHLQVPGADLPGIHHLRRLPDAETLRDLLSRITSLAVVGAGWIGLEVAAAARQSGSR